MCTINKCKNALRGGTTGLQKGGIVMWMLERCKHHHGMHPFTVRYLTVCSTVLEDSAVRPFHIAQLCMYSCDTCWRLHCLQARLKLHMITHHMSARQAKLQFDSNVVIVDCASDAHKCCQWVQAPTTVCAA